MENFHLISKYFVLGYSCQILIYQTVFSNELEVFLALVLPYLYTSELEILSAV